MAISFGEFKSNLAREVGITLRGLGNVAILFAPFCVYSALTLPTDPSGLYNGIDEALALVSLFGGLALRYVGNAISSLSSQPL